MLHGKTGCVLRFSAGAVPLCRCELGERQQMKRNDIDIYKDVPDYIVKQEAWHERGKGQISH